jgi:CBS domain containing-hemolysin-like protein
MWQPRGTGGALRVAAPVTRRTARVTPPRTPHAVASARARAFARPSPRPGVAATATRHPPRPSGDFPGRRSKVARSRFGTRRVDVFSSRERLASRVSSRVVASAHTSAPPSSPSRLNTHSAAFPKVASVVFSAARLVAFCVAAVAAAAKAGPAYAKKAATDAAVTVAETAAKSTDSSGAVIGTIALLFVYAFFCISETAITTLWPWKVREISDQEGPDSPFTELRKDITRFLTTILIGSTCSGIGSAALATEAALGLYGEAGVGMVTVALTLVTLVMCEIAPKSYAVQHATAVARVVIRPIAALSVLVYPLGRICTGIVNAFFKLLNIEGSAEPFVSEEELRLVLSGAAKSGQVDLGEQEMIQNVLEMGETPVREVMTPLVRVVGVDKSATLLDLRSLYREHKYSRVPVYDDRVDNIVGVVNSMRMLDVESLDDGALRSTQISALPGFGDSPYFVPESMSVVKLMRELLARKTHMCIVVNEFGGTIGIATFEDCVEEIVGEIYDETDTPDDVESSETYVTEVKEGVFDVDYRCDVEDLADLIGVDIPSSALYDTVGGFTCDCFDHIPEVGESMVVTLPVKAGASWDEMDGDADAADSETGETQAQSLRNKVSDATDSERETTNEPKDPLDAGFGMCPVRLTVTDGDMKMVRSVRVRVGDAAMEEGAAETDTADAAAARREARALFSKVQSRITAPEQEESFSPRVSLDDGDAVDVAPNVEVRAEKRTEKPLPPR